MYDYLFIELFFGRRFLWWMHSNSHHPFDSLLGVVHVEETHPHCSVYDLEKIFLTSKFSYFHFFSTLPHKTKTGTKKHTT